MQIFSNLFSCALSLILTSVVAVTISNDEKADKQLIHFMSSFTGVKYDVSHVEFNRSEAIDQIYNHLNHTEKDDWLQYLHLCTQFYAHKDPGPIILVVGGLSELTDMEKKHPVWIEFAQRTKGFLIIMEQRYYAQFNPTDLSTANFKEYFSSDQALYDISYLISSLKTDYPDNKWIVVGEGHGGKLAARSRMKFPHLVDGVVAVNAQMVSKLKYDEFFNTVNQKLSKHTGVMVTIKDAYKIISDDIASKKYDDLKNNLNLCSSPVADDQSQTDKNLQYMFWSVTWNLGLITKMKNIDDVLYKTNVLDVFKDSSETNPVERLKKALRIILQYYDTPCINVDYEYAVKLLQEEDIYAQDGLLETLRSGLGNRQNVWQSCMEIGYMKTSTKENMFGDVPLKFFLDICKDVFGDWYNENILVDAIKTTNTLYNGTDIDVNKTLFINYDDYPEKLFTVNKNEKNRDIKIINVPVVPNSPDDLTNEQLDDLRQKYNEIYEYIKELSGIVELDPRKIETRRVPDPDGGADNKLIQFMSSFMNVKYTVPGTQFFHKHLYQKFNNLNPLDTQQWANIHYVNEQYYVPRGSPIILVVGELTGPAKLTYEHPVWNEIAQRTRGVLIVMEQRYSGDSIPTYNSSSKDYSQYFNNEQTLYDIENLVCIYRQRYPGRKFIIAGEGYGGNLAAWFRQKFPHLVDGSMAVNAPLIPKLEFQEYFEMVNEQLSHYTNVMETIKEAYRTISEDIEQNRFDDLKKNLMLCTDLDKDEKDKDIKYMIWSITWNLGKITEIINTDMQYKYDLLDIFVETDTDAVAKLKEALEMILSWFGSTCVHVNYRQAVEWLQSTDSQIAKKMDKTLLSGIGNQQQLWKTCTEHGHIKTSTKENMFGDVKLEFFFELCKDVFGDWYDKTILENSIKSTNMLYGGKDIDTSNILFINYENILEKALTISDDNVDRNLKVINIPDLPISPKELPADLRDTLKIKYNEIYDYIKGVTGQKYIRPPNVEAIKLPLMIDIKN